MEVAGEAWLKMKQVHGNLCAQVHNVFYLSMQPFFVDSAVGAMNAALKQLDQDLLE